MDEADIDVIVVGGGIAGLACAVALGDSGLRVQVLEATDTLGGRARSWTDAATGDRVDIGPHILLSEYRNMRRLLERLGTADDVVWQQDKFLTLVDPPQAPVDIRVARLPPPLHLMPSLLKIPQVPVRELASNARAMWRVMRLTPQRVERLDTRTAEDVLRGDGVSEHFIDWFWRTAAMTVMNAPLEQCSAGALLQLMRYLMGVGGFKVGFPGVGLGDLYTPAARAAIEAAGGSVRLGTKVAGFTGEAMRATGVRLEDGRTLQARWVIAALPPQALEPLLPPAWIARHPPFARLGEFQPSPYVSVYLWFDRKLSEAMFWSKVWSPTTLNYDFYDLSSIRPGDRHRGSIIASNMIYSPRLPPLSDEEVVAATIREIGDHLPQVAQARCVHSAVHRIPMAIPAPYPGSETLRPPPDTPIEGLLLAGDWIHTGLPCSMESAVRAAWLAGEHVLAQAGRPRVLTSPLPQVEGLVKLVGRGRMP